MCLRILVAYDGSPASEAAVKEVARRPWPESSCVRLVRVVEGPAPMNPPDQGEIYAPMAETVRASLREDAYRSLRRTLERFDARPDLEVSYELRDGSVKHALLDAIREWKADLVIAGSHGTTGLARIFLGSVSHTLVSHAPCSVEIVKPAA